MFTDVSSRRLSVSENKGNVLIEVILLVFVNARSSRNSPVVNNWEVISALLSQADWFEIADALLPGSASQNYFPRLMRSPDLFKLI